MSSSSASLGSCGFLLACAPSLSRRIESIQQSRSCPLTVKQSQLPISLVTFVFYIRYCQLRTSGGYDQEDTAELLERACDDFARSWWLGQVRRKTLERRGFLCICFSPLSSTSASLFCYTILLSFFFYFFFYSLLFCFSFLLSPNVSKFFFGCFF